jgi:hypothetical protein
MLLLRAAEAYCQHAAAPSPNKDEFWPSSRNSSCEDTLYFAIAPCVHLSHSFGEDVALQLLLSEKKKDYLPLLDRSNRRRLGVYCSISTTDQRKETTRPKYDSRPIHITAQCGPPIEGRILQEDAEYISHDQECDRNVVSDSAEFAQAPTASLILSSSYVLCG